MDGPATEVSPKSIVNLSYTVGERVTMNCPIAEEWNKVSWLKNGKSVDNHFSSEKINCINILYKRFC